MKQTADCKTADNIENDDDTAIVVKITPSKILYVFLALILLFEVGIWIYGYINADEVKCNLLWCEFKSTDTYTDTIITTNTINRVDITNICKRNGIVVNCSEIIS